MYLSEILAHKKTEVELARRIRPLESVISAVDDAPEPRPFLRSLRHSHRNVGLIAEVKKASPSAGVIKQDFNCIEIAEQYARAGADCISVLTDERYFQGKLSFLSRIHGAVDLPLLRKDFTIDSYQIYEARAAGADAILLIVAALDMATLKEFLELGHDLGMDVLVETHSAEEMQIAVDIGADLIGINSRNLQTFTTDLNIVAELAPLAPQSALLVAESALRTNADIEQVATAGASAVLIGETLMRADNIESAINNLLGQPSHLHVQ
jgi:indole-3-glycerol phosphate synthase